jgi:hypothetical protein
MPTLAESLLKLGAKTHLKDKKGFTPFDYAVKAESS